jgi:DNA-binding TFAR19-related protein (PDSD5 family)
MSTAKRAKKSKKPAVTTETQETQSASGHRGRAFGFYLSDEARERLNRHAEFLTQELGVQVSASKALERLLLRMISPEGRFQMP